MAPSPRLPKVLKPPGSWYSYRRNFPMTEKVTLRPVAADDLGKLLKLLEGAAGEYQWFGFRGSGSRSCCVASRLMGSLALTSRS